MILLHSATIFDGESEELTENGFVLIENDTIREVGTGVCSTPTETVINCNGRFLMPGLIDNHFHAYSATFDMQWLDRMPKALLVAYATKHLNDTLQRGFTTVRDPGGGDIGLHLAIEQGLINGPRFFYGGKALSQTGGHGDMRPPHHQEPCNCSYSGVICQLVDGPDQVRKVAREELHRGADHIKVFISGGVASPSDPMWMSQFQNDELLAAVTEAKTRKKYVIAHCHTDEGARRCIETGIRSIDHATDISPDTASLIAKSGETFTVPTLAVVRQISDLKEETGMQPESLSKIRGVLDRMLASIENCQRAGVKVGLGTDIFGTQYHELQACEFRYRADVDKPIDILRSATSINAEIMQRKGELGVIAAGAKADLVVLEESPLENIAVFEKYRSHMPIIMRGGQLIRQKVAS